MDLNKSHSVLLCGATGLVGRECFRLLAADAFYRRVVVLTRRSLPADLKNPVNAHRIEKHVIDFDRIGGHANLFSVDRIICALGTTIRKAGSRERFREVDFGYPLEVARLGIAGGARHFLLVSAVGASPNSRIFYSRVKGELEQAIGALRYRSYTVVRPSLLLGDRQEFRPGEEIAKRLSFLAPAKFRPVTAAAVAAALVQAAREDRPGQYIIESHQMRAGPTISGGA